MKKFLPFLLCTLLFFCGAARAEAPARKQTLMIYMCGSNLESSYGSASSDIQEMLDAGLSGRDVTVLIMTGGTTSWSKGYDASQTLISELGPRGTRVVWRSEALNMGQPETLTQLLRYGMEQYPAQEYSLIIWDHGGGPMEGVCWDELFSMDHLSLQELTGALQAAGMPDKLAWIGFDACLMSSLEVAHALSPYARYMIASQETEPAYGWNYDFISGISGDADGSETGRRIIDAYFEGREGTTDILTLACLDLSRTGQACIELDAGFSALGSQIDASLFTTLSGLRMSATAFGKAVRGAGDDGYDLVDLRSLTSQLGALTPNKAALASALDDLIVYSRANVEDAGGISIYHPYVNKEKYSSSWKTQYAALDFAQGYQQYVQRFGTWLTGESLAVWSDLRPTISAPDEAGVQQVELALTEEQQAEFISAQLLILRKYHVDKDQYNFTLYGSTPASVSSQGVLQANTTWPSLYIVDSNGNRHGPLSYELTDDGEYMCIILQFSMDQTILVEGRVRVMYYLKPDPVTGAVDVAHFRVYDTATQSWTTRADFAADSYNWMYLSDTDRKTPLPDETGMLPAYWNWELDFGTIAYSFVDVSSGWHFEMDPVCDSDMDLCAVFQVTDSQQHVFTSEMVTLEIPRRTPLAVLSGPVETQDTRVDFSGYVSRSASGRGLWLEFEVTNLSDTEFTWQTTTEVIINDELAFPVSDWGFQPHHTLTPGETSSGKIAVDAQTMHGLQQITSISTDLSLYSANDWVRVPLRYEVEACNVSDITPSAGVILGVTETNGVLWELMDIQLNDSSGYNIQFRIHNNRDEPLDLFSVDLLLNQIGVTCYPDTMNDIPAHNSRVVTFETANDAIASYTTDSDFYNVELSAYLLEAYGYDAIHEITILEDVDSYHGTIGSTATVTLEEPWPLEKVRKSEFGYIDHYQRLDESQMIPADDFLPLFENQFYRISLERIYLARCWEYFSGGEGMNGNVALCLHVENLTDQVLPLRFFSVSVHNLDDLGWSVSFPDSLVLAPHQKQIFILEPESYHQNSADDFAGLTLHVSCGKDYEVSQVEIIAREPITWDVPVDKMGVMVTPDQLQSSYCGPQFVRSVDEWEGEIAAFLPEVAVPEDPQQYRRWISTTLPADLAAEVQTGSVMMLQTKEDALLRLLTVEPLQLLEDGTFGTDSCGLVLVASGIGEVTIPMHIASSDEKQLYMQQHQYVHVITNLTQNLWYSIPDYVTYYGYQVHLDYATEQAVFQPLDITGTLPEQQHLINYLTFDCHGIILPEQHGEYLPGFEEMSLVRFPSRVDLDLQPLQLSLRPLEELSDVYIMFTFTKKDGTRFSLPLIPYEQIEGTT